MFRIRRRKKLVITKITPPLPYTPELDDVNNSNVPQTQNATINSNPTQAAMRRAFMTDGVNPSRSTAHYERTVNQFNHESRPKSVQNVYDGKKMEYMQFCECVYSRDPYKYTINNQKAYDFLFYQVMREKKPVGGRKNEDVLSGEKIFFDYDDYKRIMHLHQNHDPLGGQPPPQPTNPLGYSQIEHYRTVIKRIHRDQQNMGNNSNPLEMVWMDNLENLMKLAKTRKAATKKRNYEEKITAEMIPYSTVERYPDIENLLWMRGQTNGRAAAAHLRNRFCLLFTTGGILRCESLFNADLSDFLGVTVQAARDPHPLNVLIMQFCTGKLYMTKINK